MLITQLLDQKRLLKSEEFLSMRWHCEVITEIGKEQKKEVRGVIAKKNVQYTLIDIICSVIFGEIRK